MDVIDLNCDMGESFGAWTMGSDAEMLKIVSSVEVVTRFESTSIIDGPQRDTHLLGARPDVIPSAL